MITLALSQSIMIVLAYRERLLLRVLLIAEAANPEWVSVPLVGWSLSRALATHTSAHLVTQIRNRDAILRAGLIEGLDFTAVDSERLAAPVYRFSDFLRGGKGVGWTTLAAFAPISYYYFEWLVWRQFGARIRRREFDVVHRITPLSPTTPSLLAAHCAQASTPFVLGPLNGGVPWPKQFDAARRREREWLSYVRGLYRWMPGYDSTLKHSAAIIVGSRNTLGEMPASVAGKCVYIPENAVDPSRFTGPAPPAAQQKPVRACFVGRLVPYKGPDILVEAVAPLIKSGLLALDIIGDGPLMPQLKTMVGELKLESGVTLHGWVANAALPPIMQRSGLFLFPSIREFGGGVVLEAMALGLVPMVVDYAGPGELVDDAVGFKIPLGNRTHLVRQFRDTVAQICASPGQLSDKSAAARRRVAECFTWDVKARQIVEIYEWIRDARLGKPMFFQLAS